ncbi:somatostatin receptor type 3-like, partial [Saccoglossus kowalevskii]|uniref:Somatostatin receptor type 5-like n=1 Tax=Saccoglossus kowalevskii TaxID=10224 RepID=A0ABM0MVP4_SACKO
MALISIERFQLVVCPHKKIVTTTKLVAVIVCFWIVSAVFSSPMAFFFQVMDLWYLDQPVTVCTLEWPPGWETTEVIFAVTVFLIGCCVPLIIITANYVRVYRKVLASRRKVEASGRAYATRDDNATAAQQRELRLLKMLVLIVVLFVFMWFPIFIVILIIALELESANLTSTTFLFVLCVTLSNTAINPLIYGVMNDKFKQTFREMLRCKRSSK